MFFEELTQKKQFFIIEVQVFPRKTHPRGPEVRQKAKWDTSKRTLPQGSLGLLPRPAALGCSLLPSCKLQAFGATSSHFILRASFSLLFSATGPQFPHDIRHFIRTSLESYKHLGVGTLRKQRKPWPGSCCAGVCAHGLRSWYMLGADVDPGVRWAGKAGEPSLLGLTSLRRHPHLLSRDKTEFGKSHFHSPGACATDWSPAAWLGPANAGSGGLVSPFPGPGWLPKWHPLRSWSPEDSNCLVALWHS